MSKPIKRALISVSDKSGIIDFARELTNMGVEIVSTGGTARILQEAGIAVTEISEVTGYPEMLDGRVKTLHPKVHGGLLGKRDDPEHRAAMEQYAIAAIDLVAINLYPFEETVASGADFATCIENIDIGGPAMIRSAAKNHDSVTVIVDPDDYTSVLEEMSTSGGATSISTRKSLAVKAFSRTAFYDSAISQWFARETGEIFPKKLAITATLKQQLRYGENPHQVGAFYITDTSTPSIASARQLQGKELSYNNINDTDAAFSLVNEFSEPACAIIKHANPCGVAIASSQAEAFKKALSCDPTSAYGGILAFNRILESETVAAIGKLFAEVIIAPAAEEEALEQLAKKKNLRLLLTGDTAHTTPSSDKKNMTLKQVTGGLLLQETDSCVMNEAQLNTTSKRSPTAEELADMQFVFTVAKHVKSNAIVLVKGGMTIGIGAGQMSRVDSVRIACHKAEAAGLSTKGAVLASDAFFPFDDNVHNAAKAGITAIIQPGGSIRDDEVIAAADRYDIAMTFTGIRHFNH